jgi:hypothetical protein
VKIYALVGCCNTFKNIKWQNHYLVFGIIKKLQEASTVAYLGLGYTTSSTKLCFL